MGGGEDYAQGRGELWLADLPLREGERAPCSTEPPFSFVYGGKASAELLKDWPCERKARKLDEQRTERVSVWTDPATGLQVRCEDIEYGDFPTVEWVLHFKNTGAGDTPILSDIQAVDLSLSRSGAGEFVLNHHAGDNCSPDSYAPQQLVLEPKSQHRFAPVGGRPTCVGFPYYNLEWSGEGLIIVLGWPGQWAAEFVRDGGKGDVTKTNLVWSSEVASYVPSPVVRGGQRLALVTERDHVPVPAWPQGRRERPARSYGRAP